MSTDEFDEDARAAAAFQAAFSAHAADADFAPLDPAELALRARVRAGTEAEASAPVVDLTARRRRANLRGILAVAAVVVVAVPVGIFALTRDNAPSTMAGAPAQPPAVTADTKAGGAPAPAAQAPAPQAPAAAGRGQENAQQPPGFDAASAGNRWESFLDVVVQVPAGWGYAQAPGTDWCAGAQAPASVPYVALNPHRPVAAIGCAGDVPEGRQQTHLEWRRAAPGDAAGEVTRNGWVYSSRVIGAAYVTVVHRAGDGIEGILDSARAVSVDHNGCAVAGPALAARPGVGAHPGDVVVLCQYDGTAVPNLVASTRLTGAEASGLAGAIAAAPVVAAPPAEPDCLATGDESDVTRVVARSAGGRELWLTLGNCRAPVWDNGTTYRAPERPACAPVFAPPLARWTWNQVAARVCGPA